MDKVVIGGSQWVKDMQQISKRYETNETSKGCKTARTKGTFKTRRQTKQIYIHNKTCDDTFKILLWFYIVRKIVLCVCD